MWSVAGSRVCGGLGGARRRNALVVAVSALGDQSDHFAVPVEIDLRTFAAVLALHFDDRLDQISPPPGGKPQAVTLVRIWGRALRVSEAVKLHASRPDAKPLVKQEPISS